MPAGIGPSPENYPIVTHRGRVHSPETEPTPKPREQLQQRPVLIITVQQDGKDTASYAIFYEDFDPDFSPESSSRRSFAIFRQRSEGSAEIYIKDTAGKHHLYRGNYGLQVHL